MKLTSCIDLTHGGSKIETERDEVISEMCLGINYSLDPAVKALVPSLSLSIFYCHKGRLALRSLKGRLENIRQIEHKSKGLAYFIHNRTGIGVLRISVSPDISVSNNENLPHLPGIVFRFFLFVCLCVYSCFVLLFYKYSYIYSYHENLIKNMALKSHDLKFKESHKMRKVER